VDFLCKQKRLPTHFVDEVFPLWKKTPSQHNTSKTLLCCEKSWTTTFSDKPLSFSTLHPTKNHVLLKNFAWEDQLGEEFCSLSEDCTQPLMNQFTFDHQDFVDSHSPVDLSVFRHFQMHEWSLGSSNLSNFNSFDYMIDTLSSLSLGRGPLLRGLGVCHESSSPLTCDLHDPRFELGRYCDRLSITTTTNSSDSTSFRFSVGDYPMKPPSERSESINDLAPITSNVINTTVLERWDRSGDFCQVIGLIRDINQFTRLFLESSFTSPRTLRRSKFSRENVDRLLASSTIEHCTSTLFSLSSFQVQKRQMMKV